MSGFDVIGVLLFSVDTVSIRNITIRGFGTGIDASETNGITIENAVITQNDDGIVFDEISAGIVRDSRITGNSFENVVVFDPDTVSFERNEIRNGEGGIFFLGSGGSGMNTVAGNAIAGNEFGISVLYDPFADPIQISVTGNTISDNDTGISLAFFDGPVVGYWRPRWAAYAHAADMGARVYRNNFLGNATDAEIVAETRPGGPIPPEHVFSMPLPTGGNYWDSFDEESEGCIDGNSDRVCDTPRSFDGGQDELPWTSESAWEQSETTITDLEQYRMLGADAIAPGATFAGNTAVFKATLENSEGLDAQLEVEVKRAGEAFDGADTKTSPPVASNERAEVEFSDLIPTDLHYIADGNTGSFHWRARALATDGSASGWIEYGDPIDNPDFSIKVVPLYTQVESEFPSATTTREWAGEDYADGADGGYRCGTSIGSCGCAITSAVMIARYYDIVEAQNMPVTPLELNTWLQNTPEGYNASGGLVWKSIDNYTDNRIAFDESSMRVSANDLPTLNTYLENLEPVIAYQRAGRGNAGIQHFMVIDSRLGATYSVRDSSWFNTKTLNESDADGNNNRRNYENGFDGLRVYKPGNGLARAAQVHQIHSPAELLITDSQGRRLGKDPRTGTEYNEIPGGAYIQEGIDDATGTLSPGGETVKSVYIFDPLDGRYDLAVIGTGEGEYILESVLYDEQGEISYAQFDSSIVTDELVTYDVQFSAENAENSTVVESPDEESTLEELIEAYYTTVDEAKIRRSLERRLEWRMRFVERFIERDRIHIALLLLRFLEHYIERKEGRGIPPEGAEKLLGIVDDIEVLLKNGQ